MSMLLSEAQLNVLLSVMLFLVSFLTVLFYMRFRSRRSVIHNERKYAVLEAVLSKYIMRVENSTKMIGELRTKMDIIDAKIYAGSDEERRTIKTVVDDTKSIANTFDLHEDEHEDMVVDDSVTSQVNITRNRIDGTDSDKSLHQNTVSSILKLLSRSPMTAREIQFNTKKTREHTSRLMKRLYNESLVTRNIDNKPFLYKITDEGRRLLENHSDM
jgi:DNA-binding transcriptional ArsR family regulator